MDFADNCYFGGISHIQRADIQIKNKMKINKVFLGGSLVLLITFGIFNLINFIFQLKMARMLSIADYGILATLLSIMYFLGIFSESIQTVITKYSSDIKNGMLKNLFNKSVKKGFKISLVIFALYLAIAVPGAILLKISYPLLALNGLIIFTSFAIPVSRGILQGMRKFSALGINLIIEAFVKLCLAVALVFIGWNVYGPITATIIGAIAAFFLSTLNLTGVMKSDEKDAKMMDIWAYAKPVFVAIFSITIFYSMDIIIAKIIFSAEITGVYSIASMISKIIFWGTQPISKAMFPLTATEEGKKKKKDKKENTFFSAMLLLGVLIIIAVIILWLFPDFVIKIYSGKILDGAGTVLLITGISMGLLSVANLNILHKLSRGKTNGYWCFLAFVLVEILLLFYFSANLVQYSLALLTSSAVFLWGSIILLNK